MSYDSADILDSYLRAKFMACIVYRNGDSVEL